MLEIDLKVKLNSPLAKLPEYKTFGSSGMDVTSIENVTIKQGEIKLVSTGLSFNIPTGYEIQVRPRSGLALKNGITVLNTPGTIDSDYTGLLMVILANFGEKTFYIEPGDRIAQIVICEVIKANLRIVTELSQTERGAGGFGSTGIK